MKFYCLISKQKQKRLKKAVEYIPVHLSLYLYA